MVVKKTRLFTYQSLFGVLSVGGFILLVGLLLLWGFGLIGLWGAYASILLCPLLYLALMHWRYHHHDHPEETNSDKFR